MALRMPTAQSSLLEVGGSKRAEQLEEDLLFFTDPMDHTRFFSLCI